MTNMHIREIIYLLRNAVRPVELGSVADDAAKALEKLQADVAFWKSYAEKNLATLQDTLKLLKEEQECAVLWRAFEELEAPDKDLIKRTDQAVISHTEGNANLDKYAASGCWEIIFEFFLDEVKKRVLKWPGEGYDDVAA